MWTYTQNSGQLRTADTLLIATGYAGRDYNTAGEWVGGKNNPFMQDVPDIGPLVAGYYTASELIELHPDLGEYVIHLEPDEETRAVIVSFGREPDSFFMHGDSFEHPGAASDGCIVQPRPARERFWTSSDHALHVISGLET